MDGNAEVERLNEAEAVKQLRDFENTLATLREHRGLIVQMIEQIDAARGRSSSLMLHRPRIVCSALTGFITPAHFAGLFWLVDDLQLGYSIAILLAKDRVEGILDLIARRPQVLSAVRIYIEANLNNERFFPAAAFHFQFEPRLVHAFNVFDQLSNHSFAAHDILQNAVGRMCNTSSFCWFPVTGTRRQAFRIVSQPAFGRAFGREHLQSQFF